MRDYVTYDEDGNLTGSYYQNLLEEHRLNHIFVSEAERLNWHGFRANRERDALERIPVHGFNLQEFNLNEGKRILMQIADIERETLQNRGSRELSIRLIEREAELQATKVGENRTVGEILSTIPYYRKLVEVNNTISSLRAEMAAL